MVVKSSLTTLLILLISFSTVELRLISSLNDLGTTPVASSTMLASFFLILLSSFIGLSVFLSLLAFNPLAFALPKKLNNLSIAIPRIPPSIVIFNLAKSSESLVSACKNSEMGLAKWGYI